MSYQPPFWKGFMEPQYRLLFRKYAFDNDPIYKWMESNWDEWCFRLGCEVRQYPPCPRTLLFSSPVHATGVKWGKRKNQFFVQMPSFVFIKKRPHLALAVAKKPIESDKDEVYFPPVSNVYANHRICFAYMGSSVRKVLGLDKLPAFDQRVNYFWNAAADNSAKWTGRKAVEENFGSLYNWEKMDLDEVLKKLKFRPVTMRKLVGRSFKLDEIEEIPTWDDVKESALSA